MENTSFKVFIEDTNQAYGKIYLEPLARGYGDTLGNALRRLLLSSIRGAAVTAVRIDGVLHEFSTIKGVREDVIEILMNLKHIPIKARSEKVSLNADGFKIITLDSDGLAKDFFTRAVNPGVITAKDMPWDNDFEFCGDGVLCTLEPGSHLVMEIYVEQGVGYLSAERERPSQPPLPIDALLTDAIFSPVKRVNYEIEPARVGQSIDFERLVLEVWTNGAITPEEAVSEASRIAESYFEQISETVGNAPHIVRQPVETPRKPVVKPPVERQLVRIIINNSEQLNRPIHELELSIRSENCLLRGGINTIGDLLRKSREDLLKIRNLGRISLTEIEARLDSLGLVLQPTASPQSSAANTKTASNTETEIEIESEAAKDAGIFTSKKDAGELVNEITDDADKALDDVDAYNPSVPDVGNAETTGKTTKSKRGRKAANKAETTDEKKPEKSTKKAAKAKAKEAEDVKKVKVSKEGKEAKKPKAPKEPETPEAPKAEEPKPEEKTETAEANSEPAPKPKRTRKKKETNANSETNASSENNTNSEN